MLEHNITGIKVVVPAGVATGGEDILSMSLTDLGIPAQNLLRAEPYFIRKTSSAGVHETIDEKIEIDGENLKITEGTSAFADGNIYECGLRIGGKQAGTVTPSASE